jgi:hypothetical protein
MTHLLNVTYVKVYISGVGQNVFDLCFWCEMEHEPMFTVHERTVKPSFLYIHSTLCAARL